MAKFYFALCEDFNAMAQSFYNDYCSAMNTPESDPTQNVTLADEINSAVTDSIRTKGMQYNAYAAVVFEAIAIEAFINLLGVYKLGDSFYEKYESKSSHKSTLDKLKCLCKNDLHNPYPTGDKNYKIMSDLFQKRNRIVHSKQASHEIKILPFDYAHPEKSYDDYLDLCDEFLFVQENLAEQMESYKILTENIQKILGKDFILEIQQDSQSEFRSAVSDAFSKVFSSDTSTSV